MSEKTVVVGRLRAVVGPPGQSPRRAAKVGGEPPDWMLIFPDGESEYDWKGKVETAICDAESRAIVIAEFEARGNDLVIDYEHQTLDGEIAPAAGWIRELEDRGSDGLWAHVEWTERAAAYLRAGEYRYDSPVFDVDPKTRRITALHHLAITNWPATHNRTAIDEQIAAKAQARYGTTKATAREGGMNAIVDNVKWWLNLPTTTTNNELRTHLQRVMDSIPADDQLIYVKKETEDVESPATLGELCGFSEPPAPVETADVVAAKAVMDELELPAEATLAQVHARIGELRTPQVDAAEHQRVSTELAAAKTRIAELEAKTEDEKLEQMIAANRRKITPAKEPWFRALAKKHGLAHAADVATNMKDELPEDQASQVPPAVPVVDAPVATTRRVGDRELTIDADSAMRKAKVLAIQKEKPELSYREADEELKRREATS